jgi:hypothetical protein
MCGHNYVVYKAKTSLSDKPVSSAMTLSSKPFIFIFWRKSRFNAYSKLISVRAIDSVYFLTNI